MQNIIRRLFAPGIWLSDRLSFSLKYLLIGVLVLMALLALSVPMFQHAHQDSELANVEREGLKVFIAQADVLTTLVMLRSSSINDQNAVPSAELGAHVEQLIQEAHQYGARELADRLNLLWTQVKTESVDSDPKRRFAIQTAVINTLLNLIRESASIHRLNVDQNLDATFDVLTNRLPLVLETLGKQQDALTLNMEAMESYALGAQVVLTESVPILWSGVKQLINNTPNSNALKNKLEQLLTGMSQQQDIADKVLGEPNAIGELRPRVSENLELARSLLNDSVLIADGYLFASIKQYYRVQLIVAGLILTTIFIISYLFAGIYLSTLRSLKSLSEGTDAFCRGQLSTRIKIDTQDELVLVARNFNTVASEFEQLLEVIREQNESRQRELEIQVQARTAELADRNEQLRAASERVQEELHLARSMQLAILPQEFPDEKHWAVSASMFPARELGGDFYDCFLLPDGRYGIVIADVSGKGVAAAFFMAVSRTVLLDQAMSGRQPSDVLACSNDLLCERNPMELFVTASYGIYNPHNGHFIYASAGHHASLLRNSKGEVKALPCSHDIALGVISEMTYVNHTTHLVQGDTLLLYTDGVTEAFSESNEAYGDARLYAWLSSTLSEDNPSTLVSGLVKDVADFVQGAEASDDLTCLILCCKNEEIILDTLPKELSNKTLLLDYHLPTRVDEISNLAEAVDNALLDRPDLAFSANLCLEELITNIIQHGLKGAGDRLIRVRMNISEEWLEIILKDDAPPFDPFAEAPEPDLDLDVEDRPIGGLGVHMVKMMMDDARAYYDGSGNLIILLKTLSK